MRNVILAGVLIAGVCIAGTAVIADFDKVKYPEGYQTKFTHYGSKDDPAKKRVRFFYVNPEALQAAKPGEPLPNGTVIIMEDHAAKLDAAGNPETDAGGKLISTDKVTNVFVQEKRAGWGANHADDIRNGEWEYAWFTADGAPKINDKTGKPATFEGCMACHKKVADQDFNYTLSPHVMKMKK